MTPEEIAVAYRRMLATAPDGEIYLDTVELSHHQMTKTYWLVSDNMPLTATLETGLVQVFEPEAMTITGAANNGDMSQQASVTLVDAMNILDDELSRITEKPDPQVTFRRFMLSDASHPAWGPVVYEAQGVAQAKGTFTVSCGLPKLNNRGTGLILTPEECPLIRGILA